MGRQARPLVVDLDGTLLRTDSLVEMLVVFVRQRGSNILRLVPLLLAGRASMKAIISSEVSLDWETIPTSADVIKEITTAKGQGRQVVLATASNERVASEVAIHYGFFDQVLASTDKINLKGPKKAEVLVDLYGERGFDYIGNDLPDVEVWARARNGYVVEPSAGLMRRANRANESMVSIGKNLSPVTAWLRAIRPHQWAKNLLILLPAFGAQVLTGSTLAQLVVAAALFSVFSSSVYVANDILDVHDDRKHDQKKTRPFANGDLPLRQGIVVAPLLGALIFVMSFILLGAAFTVVLAVYAVLTIAYSVSLKKIALLDVFVLTALYGIRIVAGAVVVSVALSPWLLSFSFFFFLSLALVKRYVELVNATGNSKDMVAGRGYRLDDVTPILVFGVVSAFTAAVLLALYIDDQQGTNLFSRPVILWSLTPLVVLWMSRVWLLAHRGELDHDPVKFALTDWPSYVFGALLVAVWFLAN